MSLIFHWRLPTAGDGRTFAASGWQRGDYDPRRTAPHSFARTGVPKDGFTPYDLLAQVAGAADIARFDGLWIPQVDAGEEPLIVAGGLAREARHLHLVPGLRAPLLSPVYAAKMAVSLQLLTGGRLDWHLEVHEDSKPSWHGRQWSLAEQIERTAEFLTVARGFWQLAPFNHRGRFYEVENGGFAPALQGQRFPTVHLSGDSEAAFALSAQQGDLHLLPLLPLAELRPRIARLDALAAAAGRQLRYGLDAHLVARASTEAARRELRRQWEAGGGTRAGELSALQRDDLLWTGLAQAQPGPSAVLVGSYDAIAERIRAYAEAGIGTFVLSAHPAIEQAYHLGERLLPLLRQIPAKAA